MDKNRKIVLYGTGATAKMLHAIITANDHAVHGVVDDALEEPALNFNGFAQVFPAQSLSRYCGDPSEYVIYLGIGYQHGAELNARRRELRDRLIEEGYSVGTMVTSGHLDYRQFEVNDGSLILPNVVMHPNAKVGLNVYLSSGVVLGHDTVVENHAWLNANVSVDGGAIIGLGSVVGSGAVIGAGVKLGHHTLVGPGAVVLRHTRPYSVHLAADTVEHRFDSTTFMRMRR